MTDIIIEVDEIERRGRFSATLLDGTMLFATSRQPTLDAARLLLQMARSRVPPHVEQSHHVRSLGIHSSAVESQ